MGMPIEKVKNGLMNVATVCPATPMLASPESQVVLGVSPRRQNNREERSLENNRNKVIVIRVARRRDREQAEEIRG